MADARSPELGAQILEDPKDPTACLVYADWLQAAGDPPGKLIAAPVALGGTDARRSPDRRRFATLLSMTAGSTKVLSEALKLSVQERVRVAEKLLESADAEGYEDESEVAIHAAWADEIRQRSGDLKDGSVRGLSIEEARRIVASDRADDDR